MPWIAVNVHTPRHDRLPDDAKDRIAEALRLAESLGGEAVTLHAGSDVANELLAFAQSRNVTRILLGRPRRRRWSGWLKEHVTERLLKNAGQFEITIVAPAGERRLVRSFRRARSSSGPIFARSAGRRSLWRRVAVSHVADRFLPLANLSLIFLMAVLLVAIRFGLWPSVYTSLLSFVAYNFFFTEPHHTFIVENQGDVLTVVFFLVVAVIVGNLAARLQAQVEAMRQTRQAHGQPLRLQPQDRRRRCRSTTFCGRRCITSPRPCSASPWCCCRAKVTGSRSHPAIRPKTRCRRPPGARRVGPGQHDQAAGWGSGTLPASEWLFLPLKTGRGPLGLLGVSFETRSGS